MVRWRFLAGSPSRRTRARRSRSPGFTPRRPMTDVGRGLGQPPAPGRSRLCGTQLQAPHTIVNLTHCLISTQGRASLDTTKARHTRAAPRRRARTCHSTAPADRARPGGASPASLLGRARRRRATRGWPCPRPCARCCGARPRARGTSGSRPSRRRPTRPELKPPHPGPGRSPAAGSAPTPARPATRPSRRRGSASTTNARSRGSLREINQ